MKWKRFLWINWNQIQSSLLHTLFLRLSHGWVTRRPCSRSVHVQPPNLSFSRSCFSIRPVWATWRHQVEWEPHEQPKLYQCVVAVRFSFLLFCLLVTASLPPNMGDSILISLSLPPSGKMASNQTVEGLKCSTDPSHDTQHRSPFITPVFGTISNKDVPIMSSKCKRTVAADALPTAVEHKSNKCEESIERRTSKTLCGIKRRQLDIRHSEEAEEVFDIVVNEKKEESRKLEDSARTLTQDSSDENQEDGAEAESREERMAADTKVVPDHLGVHLPQSPSTRSTFLSCLHSKPRVVLRRLSLTTRGSNSSTVDQVVRTVSPVNTSARSRPSNQHPKSDVDLSNSRNKE